jgi:hypothetical protein
MTYPLSNIITPGDATLASQYNNLRSDALYLGQAPTDAVSIGQLLERYESRLTLRKLTNVQVRVPASGNESVSLFVDGYLVQAQENVDLPETSAPNGAGTWYVFANRNAECNAFTLSISTSPTENSGRRRIGRFYFDGTAIVKDSVCSELSEYLGSLLHFLNPMPAGGRLTLSTGVPVPTVGIGSASILFYTPYVSNRIGLYVPGFGWRLYAFEELALSLSGLDANKNYDIFIHDSEGVLQLSALAWSNDTLRASALVYQDGVPVKSGSPAYRYLGTIRTLSSNGYSADCESQRLTWNMYNRVERTLKRVETEVSWTYAVAAWRALNNNAANRVEFVLGLSQDPVYLLHSGYVYNSSNGGQCVGIALDASNTNDANLRGYSETDYITVFSIFNKLVSPGYHYLQLTEWASGIGTSTFMTTISTLAATCSQWGGLGCLKA